MQNFTVAQLAAQLPVYQQRSPSYYIKGMMEYPKSHMVVKFYYYRMRNLSSPQIDLLAQQFGTPTDRSTVESTAFNQTLFDVQNFVSLRSYFFPSMLVAFDSQRHEIFVSQAVEDHPVITLTRQLRAFIESISFETVLPSYIYVMIQQLPNGYPLFTDFCTRTDAFLMGYTPASLRQWMLCSFLENDTFEEDKSPTSLSVLCSDEESVEQRLETLLWDA